jgi:hypothetical protein
MKGIKIKGKGGVTVEKNSSKNTIILKRANAELASFTVSPSNGNEDVLIEEIVIDVYDGTKYYTGDDLRVKFDNVEQYDYALT